MRLGLLLCVILFFSATSAAQEKNPEKPKPESVRIAEQQQTQDPQKTILELRKSLIEQMARVRELEMILLNQEKSSVEAQLEKMKEIKR